MRIKISIVLLMLLSPALCAAQALSDKVPADALVYLGWRGTDDLGPGFEKSHLKALLDASQLHELLNESLPRFIAKVSASDREASEVMGAITKISGPIWRRPTAFFIGGVDKTDPKMPIPKVAILCDAGDDAPAMLDRINFLMGKADREVRQHIHVKAFDHLIAVSSFDYELPAQSLSTAKDFQSSLVYIPKDPVCTLYIDGVASLATMNDAIAQFAPPEAKAMWPQIRESLGLSGFKRAIWGDGFEGKNWVEQIFVDAPAPRTGLLAMLDSAPLEDATLKLIPSNATMAAAGTFDLAGLYSTIHDAIVKFNPEVGAQADQAIAGVNQMVGFDINKDFLQAFGPQWATYIDPTTAGTGGMGFVLVNRARNGKSLELSLNKLCGMANVMLKQLMSDGDGPQMDMKFKSAKIDGIEVHTFNSPFISPSWAVKDDVLYVGLYPQLVAAATSPAKNTKSILDNPAYQDIRKRLGGPDKISSVAFSDIKVMAPDSYQGLLMISRLYLGLGDMFGLDSPPMVLPPLEKIMPELEPAGQISWADEKGFHMRALAPFPGSETLGAGGGMEAFGMLEMTMMPTMMYPMMMMRHQSRAYSEVRPEALGASNLRQIGQGILLYANDNKGAYPKDLGTIATSEDISAVVFLNPTLGHTAPENWGEMSKDDQAKWVNDNSDYVYLGAGLTQGAEAGIIVAHEKITPDTQSINMLYADGHVDNLPTEIAKQVLESSKKLRDNPQ